MIKECLYWESPQVIKPTNPLLPWINLCLIILVTISSVIIGFALIIADSSIQGALIIGGEKNLWFSILFFLLIATFVPIANWCADRFGHKLLFFIGSALFLFSIFFSAFTTDYGVMMIFRCLSAIGAGAIFPTSLTLVDLMFPPKQKTLAIALYVAGSFGVGGAIGIFLGGYGAEILTWPSIFLISASPTPIILIGTWLFFQESALQREKKYDFLGTFFYLVFIGSLVTGLANVKEPWTTEGVRSTLFITCAVLFILSFVGFIWRELTTKEPLINLRLFKIRPFILGNLAIFVVGITFFSTTTNLSFIFEDALHYSKYHTALLQVPFGLFMGGCGAISALLAKKIGPRIPALFGLVLLSISCFTQHGLTIQSDHGDFLQLQILRGMGVGFSLGPLTGLALKKIAPQDVGQAAVLITLFRQFGAALGSIVIDIIRAIRYPFHLLRFGEQMNLQSPALRRNLEAREIFLVNHGGEAPGSALALGELTEYASAQAHILAVNDAYWLIGWVASIILVVIAFFMARAFCKERFH